MANKKCKKCAFYSDAPDKQDGVTERYCNVLGEQVGPNYGCPLWKKKWKIEETTCCDMQEEAKRREGEQGL